MSLLVSRRLGINIPPNITLVNVSPEPVLNLNDQFQLNHGRGQNDSLYVPQYPRMLVRDRLELPPGPRAPPQLVFPQRKRGSTMRCSKRRSRFLNKALINSQRPQTVQSKITDARSSQFHTPVSRLHSPASRGNSPGSRIQTPAGLRSESVEIVDTLFTDDDPEAARPLSPRSRRRGSRLQLLRERSFIRDIKDNNDSRSASAQAALSTPGLSRQNSRLGHTRTSSRQSIAGGTDTEDEQESLEHQVPSTPDEEDNRLYKRNRSASVQIRHESKSLRKTVDVLASALKKKREKKLKQISGDTTPSTEDLNARARKISMGWFAKSLTNKRLNASRTPSSTVDELTPYQRFRRAARKVKNIIQVCQVCRDLVLDQVSGEDWFSQMESIIDSSDQILSKPQGPSHVRPFITFIQDKESKTLVQLTFDKSIFTRERRADYLMNDSLRFLLKKPVAERSVDEENELMMFMKRATPSFNEYSLESQRKLLNCMHYDKYEKDRVICKKGLIADAVYFVLSGTLVEQTEDHKKSLRQMKPGERFGDEDIVCGCPRSATVVTHSDVELMTIHRLDYRAIVHMADDSSDPKYLDICREDIVFRNFPMRKLIENPGVWTVLSYKYGRLMVKDSNDMEWIYIIKSGEAKIIKHLAAGKIDMVQRRKNVQKKIDENDPHAFQRKMIEFVSERDYLRSAYKVGEYHPKLSTDRSIARSAPSGEYTRNQNSMYNQLSSIPDSPGSRTQSSRPNTRGYSRSPNVPLSAGGRKSMDTFSRQQSARKEKKAEVPLLDLSNHADIPAIEIDPASTTRSSVQNDTERAEHRGEDTNNKAHKKDNVHITIVDNNEGDLSPTESTPGNRKKSSHAYINTSSMKEDLKLPTITPRSHRSSGHQPVEDKKLLSVPPFVQLESLHHGKVFGLRSCLDPNERGPSASLISGGCEVLQINKKFFMKHVDDAIISLIKVQYKPFPTEENLIDRLDNNFQWEEYKQSTVKDFLYRKGRISQEQSQNVEIQITGS